MCIIIINNPFSNITEISSISIYQIFACPLQHEYENIESNVQNQAIK